MGALAALKWMVKPLVESDVYLQSLGMVVLRNVRALLPHDPDYLGLRHFTRADDALFLDVGANVGLSALSFRTFDRRTPILSLEPNPAHVASLARLKRDDAHFDFRLVAAGSAPGRMTLHVPAVGRLALHTMASGSLEELQKSCAIAVAPRYRRRLTVRSYDVEVVRIDDLGVAPSIVKIDAEGAEDAILLGAAATLARSRPYLLLENNPTSLPGVERCLAGLDYQAVSYRADRDSFTRQRQPGRNIFFVPREAMDGLPIVAA